ncbi:MAG: DNA recombination protein RmuC [Spirochaetia bacterium]
MFIPTEIVAAAAAILLVFAGLVLFLLLRRTAATHQAGAGAETVARLEGRLSEIDTISQRVQELTSIFTVPRTRGEVGEMVLEELLRTYLPAEAFSLQHGFSDGRRVDAVVRLSGALVPVDAKFPLEGLRRHNRENPETDALPASIRRTFIEHAKTISQRYIRPEEGTMDFALMYVPSEGVYYRVFVADTSDTMREALALRVVPVSPGTLFLYLLTVSYGLRGLAFSRERNELLAALSAVRRDFDELNRTIDLLRGHLKNATKAADECTAGVTKLDRSLHRMEE